MDTSYSGFLLALRSGTALRRLSRLCALALLGPAALLAQLNITRQPDALITVPSGQLATFTVGVTASPAPTYQWRRNGYSIPNATNATYQISSARQFDNDFYDVVITSGGTTAVSQTSRLLVTLPSYPGALTVDLPRSFRLETPEGPTSVSIALGQAALPDGRFYLAGEFVSVDGVARRNLARFNADGTVDASYVAPVFDGAVRSLALQPDGKLIVGGGFRTVGGAPSGGIVRLNTDGSRDTSFAVGVGFSYGLVSSVFVAPNGTIYATGMGILGPYQGSQPLTYIARLTATGLLDPTFIAPTFSINGSSTNPFGFVLGPSGEVYAHGVFDAVNGVPRNRIARLLANGQVDSTFNPGAGPNSYVYAIVALSNGQLAIAGEFTAYNGTPVGRIARLNTNGTLDSSFAVGAGFSQQSNFLAELPGNGLFVGTPFNTLNGVPVPPGLRLNANGSRDLSFSYAPSSRPDSLSLLPGGRLLVSGAGINDTRPGVRVLESNGSLAGNVSRPVFRFPGHVRFFAPVQGGKVLVGGDFSHVNGVATSYIMRLNADLTRDTTFPLGAAGGGPSAPVMTGLVQPDGKIVLLTTDRVIRLNSDGTTDSTFSAPTIPGYFYYTPPIMLRDGRLFVPTDAQIWAGGTAITNGFVVLEANGTRATTHPFIPGPNAGTRITGVQRLPGGQLLVTGTFTTWNGVARRNIVRLNADGSVDPSYNFDSSFSIPPFPFLARNGWSLQKDGKLMLLSDGGPSDMLARFNTDGSRDRSFVAGLPAISSGGRIIVQPDDRVIVMAQNGVPSLSGDLPPVFARTAPNGGLDGSFKIRGSGVWYDAMIADNGELLSSDDTGYLHRYTPLPPPTITTQPTAQSAVAGTNIILRVAATGDEPLTYQWFKDGTPIVGATAATLALDNAQPAANGAYTVFVTNAGGSVTSQAAAVTVAPRPLAGAIFGAISGTTGSFALYIRENGTGVFLAYLREAKTVLLARNFTVTADRRVHFTAAILNPAAGTGSATEVDGSFNADGAFTGTLQGRTILAPAATTSGSSSAFVGFYEAGAAGTSNSSYTIVGANGSAYTAVVGPQLADAGFMAIDASGAILGNTSESGGVVGTVNSAGIAILTLAHPNGIPIGFGGADNEKRNDVEKLVNISTRSTVPAGGSFTAGFVVAGDRAKPVLVRAVGPTLSSFHVDGVLSAARLEVFRGSTSIAVGNDWGQTPNAAFIASTAARVGAFPLPAGSRDAMLLLILEPGAYSARVSGQGEATGVALVEVYDATEGAIPRTQRIVNISTLAAVGSGNAALTAGFYVSGTVPKRLLIRGAGPALADFGVANPLAEPLVTVISGTTQLAAAASWSASRDSAVLAAAATQVGAFPFPAGSADAALVLNLAPGSYSAVVSGVRGATGTALVEIYELP